MKDFIMLYILSPVLNEGFDRLQYKSKILVLSLLMFFSAAGIVLLIQNCGSNLIGLIMIYLLARFLKATKWGGQVYCKKIICNIHSCVPSSLDMYFFHVHAFK